MRHKELEDILATYKDKSNKDLANIVSALENDFKEVKSAILDLTETLKELEITYDSVFDELQKRLKF
jgi:hypothetical protein